MQSAETNHQPPTHTSVSTPVAIRARIRHNPTPLTPAPNPGQPPDPPTAHRGRIFAETPGRRQPADHPACTTFAVPPDPPDAGKSWHSTAFGRSAPGVSWSAAATLPPGATANEDDASPNPTPKRSADAGLRPDPPWRRDRKAQEVIRENPGASSWLPP